MIYDLIVIGGGPAGSTAAYMLQNNGYNVLLVDKASFPRKKLCGGLLTNKTLNLLQEIFDKDIKVLENDKIFKYSADAYRLFFQKEVDNSAADGYIF